jgi:hypothetical protein
MSALRTAALAVALLAASSAHAAGVGSPLRLADIARTRILTDPPAPPAGTKMPSVKVKTTGGSTEVELTPDASAPVCLFNADPSMNRAMWMETGQTASYGTLFRTDRIVTTGEHPEIERSLIEVSGDTVRVTGRQRIPLTVVARDPHGLVVYAYRTAGELFVLAPAVGGTFRNTTFGATGTDMDPSSMFGSYDCGFVAARIEVRPSTGASAVLSGNLALPAPLPTTGAPPRFVVNASVSKVLRDPEPVLSISVRVIEPT